MRRESLGPRQAIAKMLKSDGDDFIVAGEETSHKALHELIKGA